MTDKLNDGIFLREATWTEPSHVSPVLPKKYDWLKKFQYSGIGVGMMSYFNIYNLIEDRPCPICKESMYSGRWDVIGKNKRVFCCTKCELAFHTKIGGGNFKMYSGPKPSFFEKIKLHFILNHGNNI